MPAFVVALLLGTGDRTSWLAAILAERSGRPARVLYAAALAFALGNAAAAQAGLWLPRLTPNAGNLMLALALGFGGVGAVWGSKRPDALAGWRIGTFATALFGLFVLGFGEGMQFVTFALAARADTPAFAAIGATLGTLAAVAPAVLLGETAWRKLPIRPLRIGAGCLLLLIAAVLAARALRLG